MSDEEILHTGVLLPPANVTLFTSDKNSEDVFNGLQEDWRFARITGDVQSGGIDNAIEYYSNYESPDLIVIQCDNVDDSLTEKLEALAGHCDENTSAMIIGPVNDVTLYRKLIGMGVSEYVVKPLEKEQFANDLAATLIEMVGETSSRLIGVIGTKGGVGTTVLSEALSWSLADGLTQKTFLMDASAGWSTLSIGMNFEPATTLSEAVRAAVEENDDSLSRMIHEAGDKLSVLSSGGDVMLEDAISVEGYEELIDYIMVRYPIVVVDLSAASANLQQLIMRRAHEIVMVATPTLASIRAARTMLQEIKDLRGGTAEKEVKIIVNKQKEASKGEVTKAQIEEGLERSVDLEIAFDANLFSETENEQKKLSEVKGGEKITEGLIELIRGVIPTSPLSAASNDTKETKDGGIGGFLNKLTAKS